MILTDVLRRATRAPVLLPRTEMVGQAEVDELDVWMWSVFVRQHDVFWLQRDNHVKMRDDKIRQLS